MSQECKRAKNDFKKIAISLQLQTKLIKRHENLKDVRAKNFCNTDFFHTLATVR